MPWLAELGQLAAERTQEALRAVAAALVPAEALLALRTTALASAMALAAEASVLDVAVPGWTGVAWQPPEMREPSPEASATHELIHSVSSSNKAYATFGSQCT